MVSEYWLSILEKAKAKKEKRRMAYAKSLARKWRKKHKPKQKREETITSARNSKWYKAWRKLVIRQQGYICNRCGTTEGKLHVHHKKPYAQSMEERLKLANGEVLCFDCHDKEHDGYLSKKINS